MPLRQSVKYTIGKESTPGTAVARAAVLPIRDIGGLDREIAKKEDPLIAGLSMASGEYAVSADVKGPIPLSPRPCAGFGHVLKGVFGSEGTPAEIVGVVRMRYTGTSDSCKITTDLSGKTINSKIGVAGAEANDAAFGTSGTLTLTAITVDTLAELVSVIDAYANYEAVLVTGSGAALITSVVGVTMQAKGKWAFLFLTAAGSGLHHHRFYPDLAIGSERATYSIQRDGFQDNYLYDGNALDSLEMSAALKADVEGTLNVLGMEETAGQVASVLAIPSAKPFLFGGGFTSIAGVKYAYVRKHSVKIANNHNADGYGQDSLDRAYHQRGKFAVEGDMTLRLDATSILERAKAVSGEITAIQFLYFEAEASGNVRSLMLIEMPYAEISTVTNEANGDSLDISLKFKAFNPGLATNYEPPITVHILTSDSGAY
jgi:hypothetical protein